jgi:hypothetical protein
VPLVVAALVNRNDAVAVINAERGVDLPERIVAVLTKLVDPDRRTAAITLRVSFRITSAATITSASTPRSTSTWRVARDYATPDATAGTCSRRLSRSRRKAGAMISATSFS